MNANVNANANVNDAEKRNGASRESNDASKLEALIAENQGLQSMLEIELDQAALLARVESSDLAPGAQVRCGTCSEWVVTRPLRSGMLIKRGALRKNWKLRYFVLSKGHLSYYRSEEDMRSASAAGVIHLDGECSLDLVNVSKFPNKFPFFLQTPRRGWFLVAELAVERIKWVEALHDAIRRQRPRPLTASINADLTKRLASIEPK